jgi:hypothetical protein
MQNEPSVVQQIKEELAKTITELNNTKAQYKKLVYSQPATSAENLKKCQDIQLRATMLLKGLAENIQELKSNDRTRYLNELTHIIQCSIEINGARNIETVKYQLEQTVTRFAIQPLELSPSALAQTLLLLLKQQVNDLEEKLRQNPENHTAKSVLANAKYALAQYLCNQGQYEQAKQLLKDFELLTESNSKDALIKYLQGLIEYKTQNEAIGFPLLLESYTLLTQQNNLDQNLIPIIETLIDAMHRQLRYTDELYFLDHLLAIQRHIQVDKINLLHTQLYTLQTMQMIREDKDSFWRILNEVSEELHSIPITEENPRLGACYLELVKTRLFSVLLYDSWTLEQSHDYHRETLAFVFRAQKHSLLRGDGNPRERLLPELEKQCVLLVDYYSNLLDQIAQEQEASDKANLENTAKLNEQLANLSEYSSEVNHNLLAPSNQLITIEEFAQLPEQGPIDPYRLRTAQGGINPEFRDGTTLEELKRKLIINPRDTTTVPPVEIGIHQGKVYSFDTRRLIVHQQAKEINPTVYILYKKINGPYLQERIQAIFSSRPWNGIVTALRYAGKNSESVPYINPNYREQLETNTDKFFQRFPSSRSSSDPNGFPTQLKKAKKIYSFWLEKEGAGSKEAADIISRTKKIRNDEGQDAVCSFLIGLKKPS